MASAGKLAVEKHVQYVVGLNKSTCDYEYWISEHLRVNGLYWGLNALAILNHPTALDHKEVVEFVMRCLDPRSGGFGSFPGHDGHMLSTMSAVQILILCNSLDSLVGPQRENVIKFICNNQLADGSFQGDRFGEVDTRFVFNGVATLALLGELTPQIADPAVEYILRCRNFDGGFGLEPGAESHAAQVFTCLGTLAVADSLHRLTHEQQELLAWWLCERQQDSFNNTTEFDGGLNGRPEKLPDVCYSWWVMSSLAILGRTDWIDLGKLTKFILSAQDSERGGISDRPGDAVDVFHTVFGVAGLSLAGYPGLCKTDPVYCMPFSSTEGLRKWK